MEEPKRRLQKARADAGYESPSDAARALRDINKNTLISHENGNRPISRKAAEKYGRAFGVDPGWLLFNGAKDLAPIFGPTDVPLLSTISAGAMMRDDLVDEAIRTITLTDLPPGDWFALKVEGDSMDRISPPESIILVNRKDKRLVTNACYVIADVHGNATYKRYRPNPDRFEPVSTNPAHEPIFPDNDVPVVGRVKRTMLDM